MTTSKPNATDDVQNKLMDLQDEVDIIETKIVNLQYLAQHILENFFEQFDSRSKENAYIMAYEYNRYRAYMRIMHDLIYDLSERIGKISSDDSERP